MVLWRECKLGDLLEIKHGFAFLGEHFAKEGTHIVLTPGNFFDEGGFKHKVENEKWYRGPIPPDYVLSEGDLIVAMTEQAEGLLGSAAIVPLGERYLHNQRLGLVRLRDPDAIDIGFVYRLLNSRPVRQQIRASASGTKIRHTSPLRLAEVRVRVPSLAVQRRIAGILSAYDGLIENCQRRIKLLDSMARALYREWFVYFRYPRHESAPLVSSPLGEIPPGWEGKFGDMVTVERDAVTPGDHPNNEFQHFSIPAFDDGQSPTMVLGKAILSTKYRVDTTCVLLSKLNPRIPRVWLPEPEGNVPAVSSTEFLVLRPKPGFSRQFVYAKLCSEEFTRQFASLAIGTSTSHQRVKLESLLALPTVVPRELVEEFTTLVEPLLTMSEQLRSRVRVLRRTRNVLLPRLLAGRSIPLEATT